LNAAGDLSNNGGLIWVEANIGGGSAGNFIGVDVNGATIDAGGGPITITGTGGTTGANNIGVSLHNGAQVLNNGLGGNPIQITGTGGSGGTNGNIGVLIKD